MGLLDVFNILESKRFVCRVQDEEKNDACAKGCEKTGCAKGGSQKKECGKEAMKPCCQKRKQEEEEEQQQQRWRQDQEEKKQPGGGKVGGKKAKEEEEKEEQQQGISVEGSGESEGGSDGDESMEEALADYAAARDTVLSAASKELGEVVR
jgi:hypothetical protein